VITLVNINLQVPGQYSFVQHQGMAEQDVISGYNNELIARYNIAHTTHGRILQSVEQGND